MVNERKELTELVEGIYVKLQIMEQKDEIKEGVKGLDNELQKSGMSDQTRREALLHMEQMYEDATKEVINEIKEDD